jgi:hypothetical protein
MAITQFLGDEILPDANIIYDHSRTICAPSDIIFPWLIQFGKGRGGWYLTNTWERLLPTSWPASRHIEPHRQNLAVGDRVVDYGTKNNHFCWYEGP